MKWPWVTRATADEMAAKSALRVAEANARPLPHVVWSFTHARVPRSRLDFHPAEGRYSFSVEDCVEPVYEAARIDGKLVFTEVG